MSENEEVGPLCDVGHNFRYESKMPLMAVLKNSCGATLGGKRLGTVTFTKSEQISLSPASFRVGQYAT